jgi:hypothetical protein
MGQQPLRSSKKSNGVRQLRVQLKRSLILPLRMNREPKRLTERFKYTDRQTTGFSSRDLDHSQQLLSKLNLFPRQRFEPDQKVNGHCHLSERANISTVSQPVVLS